MFVHPILLVRIKQEIKSNHYEKVYTYILNWFYAGDIFSKVETDTEKSTCKFIR